MGQRKWEFIVNFFLHRISPSKHRGLLQYQFIQKFTISHLFKSSHLSLFVHQPGGERNHELESGSSILLQFLLECDGVMWTSGTIFEFLHHPVCFRSQFILVQPRWIGKWDCMSSSAPGPPSWLDLVLCSPTLLSCRDRFPLFGVTTAVVNSRSCSEQSSHTFIVDLMHKQSSFCDVHVHVWVSLRSVPSQVPLASAEAYLYFSFFQNSVLNQTELFLSVHEIY